MPPKSPAQRAKEYYLRQVAKGFKQVSIWIRAENVKAVREFVKKLGG
mgnify:CR=1 FL=1